MLDEVRGNWVQISSHYEGSRKYIDLHCHSCEEDLIRVRSDSLKKRYCKCNKKDNSKRIEAGTKFHMLTVEDESHRDTDRGVYYNVLCDCGNRKTILGSQLRQGSTLSCGCLKESIVGRPVENHGKARTKEYKVWASIISRTEHPNYSTREWYFDKGIKMSDEWRESFLKFLEDMGECPEGYTIDRIDPAKDYCKENCRWASVSLQSINKGMLKNNTSGHKGVSYNKDARKWSAYIYVNRKRYHLGLFTNIDCAIAARKLAEQTYWSHINE